MKEIKHNDIKWVNVLHPDKDVLQTLKKRYRFHALDLEDCVSESQRPKIDEYEKYLFIVLQFPL